MLAWTTVWMWRVRVEHAGLDNSFGCGVEEWWQDTDIFGLRPIHNGGKGTSISSGGLARLLRPACAMSNIWNLVAGPGHQFVRPIGD